MRAMTVRSHSDPVYRHAPEARTQRTWEGNAMFKSRNKLIGVVGALATTAAVAITGMTGASAASHAPGSSASVSGTEQFQLMTTSVTSNTASFIAHGTVFTAGGVDHQGNNVDKIVLPGGTFRIRHFNGKGSQHFNPKTCLGVI